MGNLHVHLDGTPADHAGWSAAGWAAADDDFDAAALELAMTEARRRAYDQLRDLDAA